MKQEIAMERTLSALRRGGSRDLMSAAVLLAAAFEAAAACPASVKVGTDEYPLEIAPYIKDDPSFARMHLVNVVSALSMARESCGQGVTGNCRLARFLEEAKAGLECHAGAAPVSSNSAAPAIEHRPSRQAQAGGTRQISAENCKCGPDYVACYARAARAAGSRYDISPDGRSIAIYSVDGSWATKKGWNGGNDCTAVVR